jgi:hypothetical protein
MRTLTKRLLKMTLVFLGGVALAGLTPDVRAYEFYSDTTQPDGRGNCASCHELAIGGFMGRGTLHGAHETNATGTCRLCHTSTGDVPRLGSSGVVGGLGCNGCHGQPLGTGATTGAGLRSHHARAGVPPDQAGRLCIACHTSDPIPPPESTPPAYYGMADVVPTNPCNTDGREDFWNRTTGQPDGRGLDNDGDLLSDAACDTDCGGPGCQDLDLDGYGDPGAACCTNGSGRDCDDTRADTYPGAVEAYDGRDNNCDTQTDEIEACRFGDPLDRNRLMWNDQPPAGQLYDVILSDSPLFPATSPNSVCLVLASPLNFADDTGAVPLRSAFFYLVRNTLVADYGRRSDGTLRLYDLCP